MPKKFPRVNFKTQHIHISQMIRKSNYSDMKLAAKGSVHHLLTCVGQVGFFT